MTIDSILELVKVSLWTLFWDWIPPGFRSGVALMIKHSRWISLVSTFSILQTRNDRCWTFCCLVGRHIDGQMADQCVPWHSPSPHPSKTKERKKIFLLFPMFVAATSCITEYVFCECAGQFGVWVQVRYLGLLESTLACILLHVLFD
jgi:hypothetical protein